MAKRKAEDEIASPEAVVDKASKKKKQKTRKTPTDGDADKPVTVKKAKKGKKDKEIAAAAAAVEETLTPVSTEKKKKKKDKVKKPSKKAAEPSEPVKEVEEKKAKKEKKGRKAEAEAAEAPAKKKQKTTNQGKEINTANGDSEVAKKEKKKKKKKEKASDEVCWFFIWPPAYRPLRFCFRKTMSAYLQRGDKGERDPGSGAIESLSFRGEWGPSERQAGDEITSTCPYHQMLPAVDEFNILRGHGPVNTSCSRWREGVTRELEGGVGQADRGGKGCGERPPLYAALCVQRAVISYTAQLKEALQHHTWHGKGTGVISPSGHTSGKLNQTARFLFPPSPFIHLAGLIVATVAALQQREGGEEEEQVAAPSTPPRGEDSEETTDPSGKEDGPSSKKLGTGAKAFQRVKEEEWVGKKGSWDNSYEGTFGQAGWGFKAQEVLGKVRGKDFRHEKTKKKRGSYKGGKIELGSNSIKFDSDEE
eukprot:CAMPEP_0117662352 /NCGR_PEP_ID=MMETSP0804-20121206/8010_1 /TAXON_ID=1074897 /ORGANISM="Tetraselmis astigmatica, Strain CCMP880" /LENGTH=476 /DNA_ID=CAMNT_0005469251 /DNA_START=249 /DNA_END=1682 /DNA_ORIENTATION=-